MPIPVLESAVVGPLIAVRSFVCSVGNVPLEAVLWSDGIGFAGVVAFPLADPMVRPILTLHFCSDHCAATFDSGRSDDRPDRLEQLPV